MMKYILMLMLVLSTSVYAGLEDNFSSDTPLVFVTKDKTYKKLIEVPYITVRFDSNDEPYVCNKFSVPKSMFQSRKCLEYVHISKVITKDTRKYIFAYNFTYNSYDGNYNIMLYTKFN